MADHDQTTMHEVQVGGDAQPPSTEQYGQQQYPQQYGQEQQAYPQQHDQNQQYIGGQPAAPQTYSTAQQSSGDVATGCSGASFRRVLTSPDGILRLVEWLFAVISFGAMADYTYFSSISQFQFAVAAGVLLWLWTMVQLTFYIFDLAGKNPMLHIVEFAGDAVLTIFEFAAGCAVAAKCNQKMFGGSSLCSSLHKPQASAAFAFLAFFALLGSLFFDFKKWRGSKN